MQIPFIRTHLMPALARLSNHLPGWAYWQILWRANQKFLIGAAAVIIDESGAVLLFRHTFRPAGYEWGLPGGWIMRGESIEQGLEREVYEESRLRVRILGPLSVSADRAVPRLDLIFVGKPIGGCFEPSNEVSDARFFAPDRLPKLIPDQKKAVLAALSRTAAALPPAVSPVAAPQKTILYRPTSGESDDSIE